MLTDLDVGFRRAPTRAQEDSATDSPRRHYSRALFGESRGASVIEFAIVLPIFLALLFSFYDVARLISGFSAVRSASSLGARYAAAKDRGLWNSVNGAGGFNGAVKTDTASELNHNVFKGGVHGNSSWYQCMQDGAGVTCDAQERVPLRHLYRVEGQAIAYANTALARSTGAREYPCDADKTGAPGCFRCFTLRGHQTDFIERFTTTIVGGGASYQFQNWIGTFVGIRCEYDVPITSAALLLGWLPQHLTVSGDAFIEADGLPPTIYRNDP